MAIRIWYQSAIDFSAHPEYRKALTAHFERIRSDGTEVVLHGMSPDFGHSIPQEHVIGSPFTYHRTVPPLFFRNVLRAERDGFDAFVIGTFSEPVLREIRSLAQIPVVSVAEATLLLGCSVAGKIAMVTLSQLAVPYNEKSIADHKMERRVSGVYVVASDMTERDLDAEFADPGRYLDSFRKAARQAIAAGAEAIIPSEGVVAAIVAVNGLTEVDGVPVIDSIGTPVLAAEFAVNIRRKTGVMQSRRTYPRPPDSVLPLVVQGLE